MSEQKSMKPAFKEASTFVNDITITGKRKKHTQEKLSATGILNETVPEGSRIARLEALNFMVPNLYIHKASGASKSFINITGIVTQRLVATLSGAAVYIDGVNYPDPLSTLTCTALIYLDRVAILYGHNVSCLILTTCVLHYRV